MLLDETDKRAKSVPSTGVSDIYRKHQAQRLTPRQKIVCDEPITTEGRSSG